MRGFENTHAPSEGGFSVCICPQTQNKSSDWLMEAFEVRLKPPFRALRSCRQNFSRSFPFFSAQRLDSFRSGMNRMWCFLKLGAYLKEYIQCDHNKNTEKWRARSSSEAEFLQTWWVTVVWRVWPVLSWPGCCVRRRRGAAPSGSEARSVRLLWLSPSPSPCSAWPRRLRLFQSSW